MIPHRDLRNYWTKIHQTFFAKCRRNCGRSSTWPILNIFIRSGQWSSEISWGKQKENKLEQNIGPFRKLSFPSRPKANHWMQLYINRIILDNYLNKFKGKALMKYAIDFCTSRQFFRTDLRAGTFDGLFQILPKGCHHSASVQTNMLIHWTSGGKPM